MSLDWIFGIEHAPLRLVDAGIVLESEMGTKRMKREFISSTWPSAKVFGRKPFFCLRMEAQGAQWLSAAARGVFWEQTQILTRCDLRFSELLPTQYFQFVDL